jgi:hypothetical protein
MAGYGKVKADISQPFEGLSRSSIEMIDSQFHSFTVRGGGVPPFCSNDPLQVTEDNAEYGRNSANINGPKGPFLGSGGLITKPKIASGCLRFCLRPHFDPLFHLHCGKTGRKKMQNAPHLLRNHEDRRNAG